MGNSSTTDWAANADNPLITNAIVRMGWLIKKGSTRKNWNKRYVLLLATNILLYFTDNNCLEHRGTIDLSKLKNIGTINKEPSKFIIVTSQRTLQFQANNTHDAMDWLTTIKQTYNKNKNKNNKCMAISNENEMKEKESHKPKRKDTKSTFEYEMSQVQKGLMGWLTKKGELRRNWNSRWSILIPSRLMIYFSDETCENFKGCADFRESNLMLLFDDKRHNYFFIQTCMRIWEFSCKNSQQVKQWSTILQYLIDIDQKVLILKSAENGDNEIEYPSEEILKNYFQSSGNILEILFIKKEKTYVIIFENTNAIQQLMLQNRLHIISQRQHVNVSPTHSSSYSNNISNGSMSNKSNTHTPIPASPSIANTIANIPDKYKKKAYRSRRHHSSLQKYELFALKFSEYMGNVYSSFGTDSYQFNVQKSYKSKVHSMAAARRFSSKSIINQNNNNNNNNNMKHRDRNKAKSLSFRDKYSQSAMDEFKQIYAQNESDSDEKQKNSHEKKLKSKKKLSTIHSIADENDTNDSNEYEWESEDGYFDDTSSSDDDKNANVRMTSVADRGQQTYYEPNQAKTYRQSSIFNFSPEKENKNKILNTQSPKKNNLEKMKSMPNLPSLKQCDDLYENEDEKKEKLARKSIDMKENEMKKKNNNISKMKKEMASSPILRNIVSKPKYNVLNKKENLNVFLDHMDQTVGLPNFARFVAISDGNVDVVESVYREYRKKAMTGNALKEIEMEEKEIKRKQNEINQQKKEEIHLSLKRRKKTSIASEYIEEIEYEYEYEEIEEGCAIIIDNGGGFIKAGFETSEQPIIISNQCVKSKKNDNYLLFCDESGLRSDTMNDIGEIIFPIERDKILNWDAMNAIWEYVLLNKIGIEEISEYPIMISESPGTESKLREKQLQYFMETHNLSKFYQMNTALANFYSTGKTRDDYCVIVDCGHSSTNISCIYMGCYLQKYASTIEYAGKDITQYLSKLLGENEKSDSMYFHLDTSYKIANKIKHQFCYVARDFHRAKLSIVNKKYRLPDGRTLDIKQQQYEAAEILFNPSDPKHTKRNMRNNRYKNKNQQNKSAKKSIHSQLINCVNKIDDDDVEKNMYANIYCCGGTVKLRNFTSRLQSELTQSLSRRMSIVSPQHIRKGVIVKNVKQPQLSVWNGCQILLQNDSFNDKWITAEEYNEIGPNILLQKCTHQDL